LLAGGGGGGGGHQRLAGVLAKEIRLQRSIAELAGGVLSRPRELGAWSQHEEERRVPTHGVGQWACSTVLVLTGQASGVRWGFGVL